MQSNGSSAPSVQAFSHVMLTLLAQKLQICAPSWIIQSGHLTEAWCWFDSLACMLKWRCTCLTAENGSFQKKNKTTPHLYLTNLVIIVITEVTWCLSLWYKFHYTIEPFYEIFAMRAQRVFYHCRLCQNHIFLHSWGHFYQIKVPFWPDHWNLSCVGFLHTCQLPDTS